MPMRPPNSPTWFAEATGSVATLCRTLVSGRISPADLQREIRDAADKSRSGQATRRSVCLAVSWNSIDRASWQAVQPIPLFLFFALSGNRRPGQRFLSSNLAQRNRIAIFPRRISVHVLRSGRSSLGKKAASTRKNAGVSECGHRRE